MTVRTAIRSRGAAALIGAMLLLPLALAGCSTNAGDDAGSESTTTSARAASWGACMRDAGFQIEDPTDEQLSSGVERIPADADRSAFERASSTCRGDSAETDSAAAPSQAEKDQYIQDALDFAQCMRDNGVDDFPDPATPGLIDLQSGKDSPAFQEASETCKSTVLKGWGGL